ncbi:MAG TPA: hypothetical protein VG248_11315 [Caulobacteraceae bacterium]|jgi:hypothetical protein|nr:hypothetical protein [Caulobacteraceae bacterium]
MTSRSRAFPPVLTGLLIIALGLQGCVATTVAGATLGVAGTAVRGAAKVTVVAVGATAKVAGGAVHLATSAGRHAPKKKPAQSQ